MYFFQAMSGFIMMMTQQGKLLYISENAADYLGHSMVISSKKLTVYMERIILLKYLKI